MKVFKALNGLLCADVPLRNYSLTVGLPVLLGFHPPSVERDPTTKVCAPVFSSVVA